MGCVMASAMTTVAAPLWGHVSARGSKTRTNIPSGMEIGVFRLPYGNSRLGLLIPIPVFSLFTGFLSGPPGDRLGWPR